MSTADWHTREGEHLEDSRVEVACADVVVDVSEGNRDGEEDEGEMEEVVDSADSKCFALIVHA